jgi:hypothetical protein
VWYNQSLQALMRSTLPKRDPADDKLDIRNEKLCQAWGKITPEDGDRQQTPGIKNFRAALVSQ